MKQIVVSAPGKIHILGEHVVVYGKPALLAAIDKRCVVTLAPRKDKKIQVISKNPDKEITVSPLAVLEGTKLARRKWLESAKSGKITVLTSLTKTPLTYPILAIGETLLYYKKRLPSGFALKINSDIPQGAGLGSSAAVAVAVAGAVTKFLGEEIDTEKMYDIAFRTEQKKHGRPSGGDPATVLHGGMVWFRRETASFKIIEQVPFVIGPDIKDNFYLVDSGVPSESTGEMIARVKAFHDAHGADAHRIFDSQERLTRQLLTAFRNNEAMQVTEIIKRGQRNLEKLGVVSIAAKKIVRDIEKAGGAAKISGGGGRRKGAGMLLVYHPDRKALEKAIESGTYPIHRLSLGAEGLTVE